MSEKQSVQSVEINLLYMMSQAMDKILMDAERRGLVRPNLEVLREKKMQFKRLTACINGAYRAILTLYDDIELSSADDYTKLDVWAEESNELCRLLLLYADKCGKNIDNVNEVFRLLRSLDGEGIVTEDDINRFRLKK